MKKPKPPKPIRGWINLAEPMLFWPLVKHPVAPKGMTLVDLVPVTVRRKAK